MVLNIILILIGIIILIYGIKMKMKSCIIIGIVLLCLGVMSTIIDYKIGNDSVDDHRLPYVIDNMVK